MVLDLSRVLAGPYGTVDARRPRRDRHEDREPERPQRLRGFPPYLRDGDQEFSGYYRGAAGQVRPSALDLASDAGKDVLGDLGSADIPSRGGGRDHGQASGTVRGARPPSTRSFVYTAGKKTGRRARGAASRARQHGPGCRRALVHERVRGPAAVGVGVTIGEFSATMFSVIGTLTTLRHAERTGVGQLVNVAPGGQHESR